MDPLANTIAAYDNNAESLSAYYRSVSGPRIVDIDRAFNHAPKGANLNVLEIGCADGRDASAILQRTTNYLGFDVSANAIRLAQKNLPEAKFLVADARTFEYSTNLDVVFAFASLLHLDKNELITVFNKIYASLNPGGIFYLSLKYGRSYGSYVRNDQYGERLFYRYNPTIIAEIIRDRFKQITDDAGFVTDTNTQWFETTLVKV